MSNSKYVFLGTPFFAAVILEELIANNMPPSLLICNPDRPVGRKKIISPPPTKVIAERHNIPVWQPEKLIAKEVKGKLNGAKFGILAAYGKIVPKNVISEFSKGIIGVHPSLLPKLRGPTPIQSAILSNEEKTGTTLFLMDEKVDHGPILTQEELRIEKSESRISLEKRLAELGGKLLTDMLPKFSSEKIVPTPQEEARATFTEKFSTEHAFIDLEKDDPKTSWLKIRALNPEPGTFTYGKNKKRIKLLEAKVIDSRLLITEIQIEGKTPRQITEAEQEEIFVSASSEE